MKEIYLPGMPKPKGHYAPAVIHDNLVYVSGQLPLDEQGEARLGAIEEQTALCLENLEKVLKASGTGMHQIIKVGVFIADIGNWARFNETYARIMGEHRPARVVVPCGILNRGCAIEIDCIAALPS